MFYWSKKFGSDFGSNLSFGVEMVNTHITRKADLR